MADVAPLGNCCNGGRMESPSVTTMGAGTSNPSGVETLSPAFIYAAKHGVAPLGNCCSGGSQQEIAPVQPASIPPASNP